MEEDSFSDTDYAGSEGEKVKKSTFSKQKVIPSESSPFKRRLVERIDDDEELKLVEGADALLNLAGIKTAQIVPLRSISPSTNNNNIDVKIEPKDDYEKDISGESQQEGTSQSMFAECNDSDEERLQIAEGSDSNIDNSKIKGNMAMKIKVEADPTRSINLPNAVENKSQNTLWDPGGKMCSDNWEKGRPLRFIHWNQGGKSFEWSRVFYYLIKSTDKTYDLLFISSDLSYAMTFFMMIIMTLVTS